MGSFAETTSRRVGSALPPPSSRIGTKCGSVLAAICLAAAISSVAEGQSLLQGGDGVATPPGGLTMSDPAVLESTRAFMLSRSASLHPNLYALLEACTFAAKSAVPAGEKETMFKSMGHIGQVKDEISFWAHAAHLHDVHLIGEIGFNAGHSAVTMLFQSHTSKLVSFDTADLPWAATSLAFVQAMYPDRLERVRGNSLETVPHFAEKDPRKFDLFSVDGVHDGEFPYKDMLAGRNASRPGAYVLVDDWSPNFPAVKEAWARAQKEGWITEILCADKGIVVDGYRKAYCLGQYAA